MGNKHTAGKWAIRDLEIIGPINSNKSICEITGNFMDEEEAAANAKLIAAAPELLQVLQDILNDDKMNGILTASERVNAKNAINKATA